MNEKFMEVLTCSPDSALSIVTCAHNKAHLVNSWNSYVIITDENHLLIPAGRMYRTQNNLEINNRVQLTICNREVVGKTYKGTGFLVEGTATFETAGSNFDKIKERFPWARAALVIKPESFEQTL